MGLQPLLRWIFLATVMLLLLGACGGGRLPPVAQATIGPTPAALPTTVLPTTATATRTPTRSASTTMSPTLMAATASVARAPTLRTSPTASPTLPAPPASPTDTPMVAASMTANPSATCVPPDVAISALPLFDLVAWSPDGRWIVAVPSLRDPGVYEFI